MPFYTGDLKKDPILQNYPFGVSAYLGDPGLQTAQERSRAWTIYSLIPGFRVRPLGFKRPAALVRVRRAGDVRISCWAQERCVAEKLSSPHSCHSEAQSTFTLRLIR